MSQENVEAARAIWPFETVDLVELFNRSDMLGQIASAIPPDTEIVFGPGAPGERPTYYGPEGFAAGWRDWLEPYENYWLEVEDFIDAGGDEVVLPARVRARTRRDGVQIGHAPAAVCRITNGKITRVGFYLDRAEALEAVGLSGS